MASITAVGGVTFANLGAVTTTFTAAPACSTSGFLNVGLGLEAYPSQIWWNTNCDKQSRATDCLPHDSVLSERISSWSDSGEFTYNTINYYSPGLYCPHGWATVGQAAKGGDGTVIAEGIFETEAPTSPTTDYPTPANYLELLTSILAPSETAVVCCPSGFEANDYGTCYSNFPVTKLAQTTFCAVQLTDDFSISYTTITAEHSHTTEVGEVPVPVASEDWRAKLTTRTLTATSPSSLPTGFSPPGPAIGINSTNYVILRHRGSPSNNDTAGGKDDAGENDDATEENGDTAEGNGDDESAAPTLGRLELWTAGLAGLAVWGVGVFAGVGL